MARADPVERNFAEQVKDKQFELGIAHLIDIKALRAAAYTPQPY